MLRKAYRTNIITFVLIVFSVAWMFSGIRFGGESVLEAQRWKMLKYYTVDSNILMGITALMTAYWQKKVLDGQADEVPVWVYTWKLIGVVGVTLTMLVTVCFLSFMFGAYTVFNNSNFFLHLVNPILSLICFLGYERTDRISFKATFAGISSMLLYAVYYVGLCLMNSTGNTVNEGYDWYGFFALGLKSGVIVLPLIIGITWLISFVLWKLNRSES